MINAKRYVIGILALVMFGLFLGHVGQLGTVVGIAQEVLPEPKPAPSSIALPAAPELIAPPEGGGGTEAAPTTPLGALDAIGATTTRPPAPYERDQFGPRWADVDGNNCDTRNDILARDLLDAELRAGDMCIVISGTLSDPYTGTQVDFDREVDAGAVPIDHVVALSWAWQNGAHAWSAETRARFANDPLNLQATTRSANSSKSDDGPSGWLPENDSYRCDYLARFIAIVATYNLTFPEADFATTRRELAAC